MTEAKKRDTRGPVVDIISLTMIPSSPVKEPRNVVFLRARLMGAPLSGYQLDGDRQSFAGDVVEIRREDAADTYRIPYTGGELAADLAPNALVQSDDAKIIAQAVRILSGERDARTAVKKLNDWVYSTLRKKPVVSVPSAVEVLDRLEGDCNEHTTLFTALARSIGIPTRMAAGIVYMAKGFYYHAWPEVWLGKWTAVDPTFGEFPADATHIRFVTGSLDRQSDIVRLVGKLQVEVLEYR